MAPLTYVTIADLTIGDKICFCTNCSYLKYGTSQCLVFTNLKDVGKVWSFDSFLRLPQTTGQHIVGLRNFLREADVGSFQLGWSLPTPGGTKLYDRASSFHFDHE